MSSMTDREMLELAARMKAGLPLDVSAEARKLAEIAAAQRQDSPPPGWVETLSSSIEEGGV